MLLALVSEGKLRDCTMGNGNLCGAFCWGLLVRNGGKGSSCWGRLGGPPASESDSLAPSESAAKASPLDVSMSLWFPLWMVVVVDFGWEDTEETEEPSSEVSAGGMLWMISSVVRIELTEPRCRSVPLLLGGKKGPLGVPMLVSSSPPPCSSSPSSNVTA